MFPGIRYPNVTATPGAPSGTPIVNFVSTGLISNIEGTTTISIDVSIDVAPAASETVEVAINHGTTVVADFTDAATKTLTFPIGSTANQTATFTINDDALDEGVTPETYTAVLQNPSAGLTLGAAFTRNGEIIDNDGVITNQPPIWNETRRNTMLASIANDSRYYDQLVSYVTPRVTPAATPHEIWTKSICVPVILYGTGANSISPTYVVDAIRLLIDAMEEPGLVGSNFHNSLRNTGTTYLANYLSLLHHQSALVTSADRTRAEAALATWADKIEEEIDASYFANRDSEDSDLIGGFYNICTYLFPFLSGTQLTKLTQLRDDLRENGVKRNWATTGTLAGGNYNESPSYDNNSGHYYNQVAEYGLANGDLTVADIGSNHFSKVAENLYMSVLPDLKWISKYNDHQNGSASGVYQNDYITGMELDGSTFVTFRGQSYLMNGLQNTIGEPCHKAILHILDNVANSTSNNMEMWKLVTYTDTRVDDIPASLSAITGLPQYTNPGDLAKSFWRESIDQKEGMHVMVQQQLLRNLNHNGTGAQYSLTWTDPATDETKPISHESGSGSSGNTKRNPCNTLYIRNNVSRETNEASPLTGWYRSGGHQGPNSEKVRTGVNGISPVNIGVFGDADMYTHISENYTRYHYDIGSTTLDTAFLQQWNRAQLALPEGAAGGLFICFDQVRMDTSDIADINRMDGTSLTNYNRPVTKVTRCNSQTNLVSGWYETDGWGTKNYYKPFSSHTPIIDEVDEQSDAPYATDTSNGNMYGVDKIAHIEETCEDTGTGEDLIWFLGVQSMGGPSNTAPTTFGPFFSSDNSMIALGVISNGTQYLIAINRDPTAGLTTTNQTINFSGMTLAAGDKIRLLGVNAAYTASNSGSTLTLTAGAGALPNVGKSLGMDL